MVLSSRRWARLLNDSFWSLFGNIAVILGGVLQYKVVAALVPAGEYGGASLVLGVLALLNMFLINPLLTAQLRLFFDYAQKGMGALYQRRFGLVLYVASAICVVVYIGLAVVLRFRGIRVYWELAVPAVLVLILTPQAAATTNFLEIKRRYRDQSLATLIGRLLMVGILAALLLTSMSKAAAVVLAGALAPLAVVLWFNNKAKVDEEPGESGSISPIRWVSILGAGFGGALYLSNFFMWCVTTSDRYVIGHCLTLQEVGVYTMNYGLWSVPYLALNGWLETTLRARFYARAASGDWKAVRRITRTRLGIGVGIGLVGTASLYLIGPIVAHWFLGRNYSSTTSLMMILATAHVFYVAANSIVPVFLAAKKAQYIVMSNAIAAASNIGLNLWLVPKYGILAAAANTLAAYVVLMLVTIVFAHLVLTGFESRPNAADPGDFQFQTVEAGASK